MSKNSRIIEIAQRRGNTATTKAGAWRYLLSHLPKMHPGLARLGTGHEYHDTYAARNWLDNRRDHTWRGRAQVLGYSQIEALQRWEDYCQAYEDNAEKDRRRATWLDRTGYGNIIHRCPEPAWDGIQAKRPAATNPAPAAYWQALTLLEDARRSLHAYDSIDFTRKGSGKWDGGFEGGAVHIELYDFAPDAHAIVVCRRETEGGQYGVKTVRKQYYLIQRTDDGDTAVIETKQPVARMANLKPAWGVIVEACETGKRPKLTPKVVLEAQEQARQVHVGYKLLAQRNGDPNHLASVWDGSKWDVGSQRTERVKPEHGGGLYYYRDLGVCLAAAAENSVFTSSHEHHKLIIVRVEATGRHMRYAGEKYAAEKITPVEVIGCTI